MAKDRIDIYQLSSDIFRVCGKTNQVEFCGSGIRLNGTELKFDMDVCRYGATKIRFSSVLELLKELRSDGVLICSKEDLNFIISHPWQHSHKVKKPFIPKDPNSHRTKKFLASNIKKFRDLPHVSDTDI
jgi:hypothetical protein